MNYQIPEIRSDGELPPRDCPRCGKEDHFYVNVLKRVGYCQRCQYSVKLNNLEFQNPKKFLEKFLLTSHSTKGSPSYLNENYVGYLTKTEMDYLEARGIPIWIYNSLKIFRTSTGILFVFPGTNYWQIRNWTGFQPPRWKNKPGVKPKELGISYLVQSKPNSNRIVLTEGIIDALVVAQYENSAALLSKYFHVNQLEKLSEIFDIAILLEDGDVSLDVKMKNYINASRYFKLEKMISLPIEDDPASLSKEKLKRILM